MTAIDYERVTVTFRFQTSRSKKNAQKSKRHEGDDELYLEQVRDTMPTRRQC